MNTLKRKKNLSNLFLNFNVILKCTCLEIGHLAIVFFDVLAGKEANIGLRRIRKNYLRIGNCDPIGRMGSVKHPDDNCYA